MVDDSTQDPRPEFAVRPGDASWLAGLPRVTESAKHDWRAIHCLVTQRRADGIAPIVLETTEGQCLRPPAKYEGAFELFFATCMADEPHWMKNARSGRCCPTVPRLL